MYALKRIFIFLTFFIILYIALHLLKIVISGTDNKESFFSEPCDNNLTDLDYLKHMIPHHQVAVDISILLQHKSKNPTMKNILRKIIWIQNYEISLMKEMTTKLPNFYNNKIKSNNFIKHNYISTVGDYIEPNKLGITDTYCDPHFFDPQMHNKHLEHMVIDDIMYIKHMIPHHQVAVDMSKKLLKNTKNNFMIYLAYRIINSQQEEIILLNDLLKKNNYRYQSELI